MLPVALITGQESIDPILAHLRLPLCPAASARGSAIAYDVSGEPMPAWAVGGRPLDPDERCPLSEAYCVAQPAPVE